MKTLLTTLTTITICLVTSSLCHAQWKGDGTQRWESSVPYEPLTTLPQLHSDMPLDCMLAYIVMDSVARSIAEVDYEFIRNYPAKTTLDTFKVMARFFYALYDYDPILSYRYIISSNQAVRNNPEHFYQSYPVHLLTGFRLALRFHQKNIGVDKTLLLNSDLIVRVQVLDKVSGIDTSYASSQREWVNYVCQVLDTIKGMHLPQTCSNGWEATQSGHQTQDVAPLPDGHCLIYGHAEHLPSGELTYGLSSSSAEVVQPVVGDIVYLFLAVGHEFDYLTIRPQNGFDKTGGVFIVRDGKVQDIGNFWGLGTTPDETTFCTNLDQKIDEIKSWWIN